MSSSVRGVGGKETIYRKHCRSRSVYKGCKMEWKTYFKAGLVFLLLLVDYAETEVDLV